MYGLLFKGEWGKGESRGRGATKYVRTYQRQCRRGGSFFAKGASRLEDAFSCGLVLRSS